MGTIESVGKAIQVMAEVYGRTLSPAAALMMAQDLSEFEPEAVLMALQACRKDLNRFPTIADIVSRVESKDGRPGAEEAWAMIPKDEFNSCVWTVEMATAYGAAHPHIRNRDLVAARMAFKEVYEREVKAARELRIPAAWSASLGEDKSTHEGVLSEAVRKNRLTLEDARKIAPMLDGPRAIHPKVAGFIATATKTVPEGA